MRSGNDGADRYFLAWGHHTPQKNGLRWVTPVEGRDLSSRQTQDVVRDIEIGQPINSAKRSETADGVARESEGRTRLPLLRPLRQDRPRGHSGARLCSVPLQQGRTGRGPSGLRGRRGVRSGAMAWRTGACAQAGDVPTGPYQTRVHTEGQRQTQAAGHLNLAGSGLHDGSDPPGLTRGRSSKPTFHRNSTPTVAGETPNRRWSRWRNCCF